ncbi:unnamed protein product, partial [Coffea canephora]
RVSGSQRVDGRKNWKKRGEEKGKSFGKETEQRKTKNQRNQQGIVACCRLIESTTITCAISPSKSTTNSSYAEFRKENSCYWYDRLIPILLGKHAIGSRAQSASKIVPPEPSRCQRANTSARSRKEKGKASNSRNDHPRDMGE